MGIMQNELVASKQIERAQLCAASINCNPDCKLSESFLVKLLISTAPLDIAPCLVAYLPGSFSSAIIMGKIYYLILFIYGWDIN
jgi:hypothetical protein